MVKVAKAGHFSHSYNVAKHVEEAAETAILERGIKSLHFVGEPV